MVYVCEKDSLHVSGFRPLKKGEALPGRMVTILTACKVRGKGRKKVSRLELLLKAGVISKKDEA